MAKWKIRVWITDIEVEADTRIEAEGKATEIVDSELQCTWVGYAEAQEKLVARRNCCIDCIAFCCVIIDEVRYGWCTFYGHDTAPAGGCCILKARHSEDICLYPFESVPIRPLSKRGSRIWYKNPYLRILDKPRAVKEKDKAYICATSKC